MIKHVMKLLKKNQADSVYAEYPVPVFNRSFPLCITRDFHKIDKFRVDISGWYQNKFSNRESLFKIREELAEFKIEFSIVSGGTKNELITMYANNSISLQTLHKLLQKCINIDCEKIRQ